jgi:hypothetical protein
MLGPACPARGCCPAALLAGLAALLGPLPCFAGAHLVVQSVEEYAAPAVHQERCRAVRQRTVRHKLQAGGLVGLVARGPLRGQQPRRRLQPATVQQAAVEVEAPSRVRYQQLGGGQLQAGSPHAAQGRGLAQGDAADGPACSAKQAWVLKRVRRTRKDEVQAVARRANGIGSAPFTGDAYYSRQLGAELGQHPGWWEEIGVLPTCAGVENDHLPCRGPHKEEVLVHGVEPAALAH